jgi:ABC-type multidrug transport system ATPase subunit
MVTMLAIEMKDLATRHEDKEAVNGVTLDTVEGKCCGLLKPNGIGKTTTTTTLWSCNREWKRSQVRSPLAEVSERDRPRLTKDRRQCERVT